MAVDKKGGYMFKKMFFLGLCMMFLLVSSFAFASDVYVTENGKKYHKADCRFVKNREAQEIDKDEAIAQGYKPCGRCFKEDLVIKDSSKPEKTASTVESKKDKKS